MAISFPPTPPLHRPGIAAMNQTLYLVGGSVNGTGNAIVQYPLPKGGGAVEPSHVFPLDEPLLDCSAFPHGGDRIIIVAQSSIITFNTSTSETGKWNFNDLAIRTFCHASALFREGEHKYLLLFGGIFPTGKTSNLVYKIPLSDNPVSPSKAELLWPPKGSLVPKGRVYISGCNVKDRYFYTYGGAPDAKTTTAELSVFNDFWRFDTETNTWEELHPKGDKLPRLGSYSMRHRWPHLYIYGGCTGEDVFNRMHLYHILTNTWETQDANPAMVPRFGHSSYYLQGRIYHFGGHSSVPTSNPLIPATTVDVSPMQLRLKELVARFIIENRLL